MLHARFRWLRGHASGAAQIARSPTSCVDSTAAVRVQPSQLQCYPAHFGRHRHGTLLFACRVQQHTVRPSAVSKAVNRVKQSDAACAHTCACCGPHTNPVCRIRPKLQRPGYLWQSPQALSYLPAPAAASDAHSGCLCHPGLLDLLHLLTLHSVFADVGLLTRRWCSWLMCTQICSVIPPISCRRWSAF